ncbi:MAG: peptide chain release factor-like protein [Chloroflexi bacterium]|nr:peptide chain release factor-like protein [Chloroflexota bacterium]
MSVGTRDELIDLHSVRSVSLRLSDLDLIKECREERYKSSGPGGQHRNKVETAVRLHHLPTGLTALAAETRSLQDNRIKAAHRLREKIALEIRTPLDLASPSLPTEFIAHRGPRGSLSINPQNPDYPIIVATILDGLAAAGSYARAAHALGLTTSQLLRFLKSDPHIWRDVQEGKRLHE